VPVLTAFPRADYDRRAASRGWPISEPVVDRESGSSQLERLELALRSLLERVRLLIRENRRLREELGDRERRLRALDERLFEMSQRRQDVAKRVDDLITTVDQLEARYQQAAKGFVPDPPE